MAKIRIYEIAKELKVQSKEVVKFLKEKNINDKVASSSIEGETIAMVRNQFAAEGGKGQKPEAGEKGTGTGKPEPARKQQESPKAGEPQKAGKSQKAGETQKTGEPKKVEETRKEEGARMSEEPKKVTEGKGLGICCQNDVHYQGLNEWQPQTSRGKGGRSSWPQCACSRLPGTEAVDRLLSKWRFCRGYIKFFV